MTDVILYYFFTVVYSMQISDTYRKSVLGESFVKTVIDGFSSGSLKIFFKVLFDRRYLPP